jgi:hypothetical protein
MKKLLITLLCISSILQVQAQQKIFAKQKELQRTKAQTVAKIKKDLSLRATVREAQIEKYSDWDAMSSSWIGNDMTSRTFVNGVIASEVILSYDGIDTLFRINYTHDNQNKLVQAVYEQYAPGSGRFIPTQRQTYTRTSTNFNNLITLSELYNEGNNAWDPAFRTLESYDDRGNERQFKFEQYNNGTWTLQYGFDQISGQIIPNFRVEKTYNANGQVQKIFSDYYIDNQWTLGSLDSVIFNQATSEPQELYSSNYDSAINAYSPAFKFYNLIWDNFDPNTDIYNTEPDSYTVAFFIFGIYSDVFRISVTRPDANGSLIELEEEFDGQAWRSVGRYNELYDSNKNLIEESSEEYVSGAWQYQGGNKFVNTYDMNNDLSEIIEKDFDTIDSLFVNAVRAEFSNYINVVSAVGGSKNNLDALVFPNPCANGKLFVQYLAKNAEVMTYKVISMSGQLIMNDEINVIAGTNQFALPTLQAGFYIIQLETENELSQYKVLVQ